MPLLVNSVPNLAQGVSQQPDNLRYPGQCDEQINAWATVVEGLVKRPPTTYTKKIDSSDPGANLFTHFVKRDETNKYCVAVSLGGIGVIDLDTGNNIPVTTTATATSYLSGITNPLKDLRALTVADYTFLVNNKKTVSKNTTDLSKVPEDEAIIFVKLGDYNKSYSIYIDDNLVPLSSNLASNPHSYTQHGFEPATYISGGSSTTKYADTGYIAQDLATCLEDEFNGTLSGIDTITVTSGGGDYYGGSEIYKVEVEITSLHFLMLLLWELLP